MNFPLLFPSLMIFVHFFRRVPCDMESEKLKKAIASDNIRIVEIYLKGENRQRVLREALIKVENGIIERMARRTDSRLRLSGNGALHYAVIKEAPKVTRLLLENGADVNMLNFQGLTPLFLLATKHYEHWERSANVEVLDTLLQFKADIHVRDDLGFTALSFAAECPNILLVKKLLEHGGNVNERCGTGMGKALVQRTVEKGYVEMTKFLLDNGAEVDVRDSNGMNVLHIIFDTRYLYFMSWRWEDEKDQVGVAKLLLRSKNVENMLTQRENCDLKTPVDIFFKQDDPNREILVDLLKILPSLKDAYGISALRSFSPSLEQHSSTWPTDNFPEYVKFAFNSYLEILYEENSRAFNQIALTEFFSISTGVKSISPAYDIKYFVEKGLYSLYVILQAHFRIRRRQDRYEKAADEVEKFDEYLRELSAPFQNALSNALAKGMTLEILPTDVLTKIFLLSQYNPYIERMTKIMSLVQFTGTQRWSVEEMADAAPAFRNYIERKDIFLL